MAKVQLSPEQELIKNEIVVQLNAIREKIKDYEIPDNFEVLINQLGELAHELHVSLTLPPKHHRYMIKNRKLNPEHPDFYKHIHPVEDLLAYLADDKANDDPEDQTIGSVFYMEIYTRRWGHSDRYQITRVDDGWCLKSMGGSNKKGGKNGRPGLFQILDNDSVNYPEALPEYMEYLWEKARTDGLTQEEVQKNLNELSEWVSDCEIRSPKGIFRGLK